MGLGAGVSGGASERRRRCLQGGFGVRVAWVSQLTVVLLVCLDV